MKLVAFICLGLALLSVVLAGEPKKPVWPTEFSTPFGFNMAKPPTQNKSATLFYNWHIKSQRIDYHERCVPFISVNSYWHPCKLYFNPNGVYVHQPATGNECCLMFPKVGSIPPAFLKPFNFSNVENAVDMWDRSHKCNHWVGIDEFAYWTDVATGEDVQFKDGATGVFWNFGVFDVSKQDPKLFTLPSSNCNAPCNSNALALAKDHIAALDRSFAQMSQRQTLRSSKGNN